jgi:hypothetical protein
MQRVIMTTRTLFGRHRMGYVPSRVRVRVGGGSARHASLVCVAGVRHIFPIQLNVTRMDMEFAAVMQRVPTHDEYIMFLSQSLTVTAASQGSLALLGVCVNQCMLCVRVWAWSAS